MVATAPELSVHSQGCVTQQNMKESCFRAGHGGWLTDGAIANCGTRALTTSGDELAVVWDMVKGSCLNVLEGHSGEVRSVVLTRRGRSASTFYSRISADYILPGQVPRQRGTLCRGSLVSALRACFSKPCTPAMTIIDVLRRFAVTGSADCTARVWDLDATSAHTQGTHTGRVSGLVINGDTAITFGALSSGTLRLRIMCASCCFGCLIHSLHAFL